MSDALPRLLRDDPAPVDEFGGHRKTAEALAHLIRDNTGGYAIALEGTWGAGKSTVVTLLQDELTGDDEDIVVFDAWAHQGDPLRRSFLETLVRHFTQFRPPNRGDWIDTPRWVDKLDSLAGRKKTSTRNIATRVRLPAMLAALGLLFVPLGFVVLNHQVDSLSSDEATTIWFAAGAILVAMPLIGAVVGGCIRRFNPKMHEEDVSNKSRFFDPIVGNEDVVEKTTSIESPDPTSIEFEAMFRDLMSDALGDSDRRLVIVFDNLDRVAPSDALSILATMQTFLSSGPVKDRWRDRLFVVVPYDDVGLRNLWGGDGANQDDGAMASIRRQVATEQLDKLFRVRLRVPPLLLTDWRKYLSAQLSIALPQEDQVSKRRLIAVFAAHRADLGKDQLETLTPRRLKRFINELVALRLQHPKMDLPTLGYYATHNRLIGPINVDDLAKSDVVPARVRRILGEEVDLRLAALHFGRDDKAVRHMLIAEPVERSLLGGKTDAFAELAKNEGIWDVFESLPFDEWFAAGGEDVGLALNTLVDARPQVSPSVSVDRAVDHVREALPDGKQLAIVSEASGNGIASLGTNPRDDDFLARLFSMLGDPDDAPAAESVLDRASGLLGFLRALPTEFELPATTTPLRFATSAAGFVALAAYLHEHRDEIPLRVVRAEHPASSIDAAAVEAAELDSGRFLQSVSGLTGLYPHQDFSQTRERIRTLSTPSGPSLSAGDFAGALLLLGGPGREDLQEIAGTGALYHHYSVLIESMQVTEAARVLLAQLESEPSLPAPPTVPEMVSGYTAMRDCLQGNGGEVGEEVRDWIVNHAQDRAGVMLLISAWEADDTRHGIRAMLEEVMTNDGAAHVFDAQLLVEEWFVLVSMMGMDSEALSKAVERVRSSGNFERVALEAELEGSIASLAIALLRGKLSRRAKVQAWTERYLRAISAADWTASLDAGNDNIGIVAALEEAKLRPSLGDYFEDALASAIEADIAGERVFPVRVNEGRRALLAAIGAKRSRVFLERLGTRLDARGEFASGLRDRWGAELVELLEFRQSPQFLRVASRVAASRDSENIAWISEVLAAYPEVVSKAEADELLVLNSSIQTAVSHLDDDGDDELRERLKGLGQAIKEAK